eukprot:15469465-Alexandrium_andersonii.AAC.1
MAQGCRMRGSAGARSARTKGRTYPSAAPSSGEQRRRPSSAGAPRSQASGGIFRVATHRGRGNQPPTGG